MTTGVPPLQPVIAYIGLGANLQSAGLTLAQTLHQAARALSATSGIHAVELSPLYRSTPVDAHGPDYLNAVARLHTTLDAEPLLDCLQAIEHAHGRTRPWRNAPRTLDLDLLLLGDQTLHTERLTLPHPRMHERAFVLRPLQDLAPDLRLPQGCLAALLAACAGQEVEKLAP